MRQRRCICGNPLTGSAQVCGQCDAPPEDLLGPLDLPRDTPPAPMPQPLAGDYVLRIVVLGEPAPQGSKSFKGMFTSKKTGRQHATMVESSKKVAPWREDVVRAARAAHGDRPPMDGALRARMVFTLKKPASAPKSRRSWPNKKPDLSKLLRSTEDALVNAGVIADDARIVEFTRLAKVFPGEDGDALTHCTGARIEIEVIEDRPIDVQRGLGV